MSQTSTIQEWYYMYDADLTFGEVHISKIPKIILIIILICIGALSVSAFIFKDYVKDFIINPQIEFDDSIVKYDESTKTYYVEAEVSEPSSYNLNNYIDTKLDDNGKKDFSNLQYKYVIENSIDKKELGEYTINYKSFNKVRSSTKTLVVKLVDTIPPTINLELSDYAPYHVNLDISGNYQLELIRGKETDSFNPKNYIRNVTDNYTKDESKIKVDYIKNIDFSNATADVVYTATDEAGNVSTTSLKLIINDDIDKIKKEQEEKEKELKRVEEERAKLEEKNKKLEENAKKNETDSDKKSTNSNTSSHAQTSQSTQPQSEQPTTQIEEPIQQQEPDPPVQVIEDPASISADDLTISIKEGEETIINRIIESINYIGNTGVARPTGMPGIDVPLEVGTYEIFWESTNGLSCTQTVTITE